MALEDKAAVHQIGKSLYSLSSVEIFTECISELYVKYVCYFDINNILIY